MCVDEQTARQQGIPGNRNVVAVHVLDSKVSSYFVYIVGDAGADQLALAAVSVFNGEWELKLTQRQLDDAVYRVRLALTGVISANELAKRD